MQFLGATVVVYKSELKKAKERTYESASLEALREIMLKKS
jgi:hypothetical protein